MKMMLTGYNGRMGRAVIEAAADKPNEFDIVAGVDINPAAINLGFPVYTKPSDYKDKADIIIDFSHHSAIDSLLEYADWSKTPLVIATTGHTDEETALIKSYANKIAMFKSANMSIILWGLHRFCVYGKYSLSSTLASLPISSTMDTVFNHKIRINTPATLP